jgi:predicted permease
VTAQVTLSVVVLIAATLFVRSLVEASHIDVGFVADKRTMATVQLGRQGYTREQASQFYETMLARLRALPGVDSVTTTAFLPLSGGYLGDRVIYQENEVTPSGGARPAVILDRVGPDYFRTVGTTLLRGRDITDADRGESPAVETFARTFWAGADPIGKRFRIGAIDAPLVEVIGLAPDGRYQSLQEPPQRRMFLPVRQDLQLEITWIVHTDTSPSVVLDAVRREVSALDFRLPVINATTLQAHVDRTLVQSQVFAVLATMFGAVALLLASLGIYGMLSLMVRGQRREIGIRVALGARPSQVLRMVIRRGAVFATAGLATGGLVGSWTSGALAPMLYGGTAFNAWTLLVVAGALGPAVLLASVLPARRALRVDPAKALRQD